MTERQRQWDPIAQTEAANRLRRKRRSAAAFKAGRRRNGRRGLQAVAGLFRRPEP